MAGFISFGDPSAWSEPGRSSGTRAGRSTLRRSGHGTIERDGEKEFIFHDVSSSLPRLAADCLRDDNQDDGQHDPPVRPSCGAIPEGFFIDVSSPPGFRADYISRAAFRKASSVCVAVGDFPDCRKPGGALRFAAQAAGSRDLSRTGSAATTIASGKWHNSSLPKQTGIVIPRNPRLESRPSRCGLSTASRPEYNGLWPNRMTTTTPYCRDRVCRFDCGPRGRHPRSSRPESRPASVCAACVQSPRGGAAARDRRRAGAGRHAAAMVARRARGDGRRRPGAPPRRAAAAGRHHPRGTTCRKTASSAFSMRVKSDLETAPPADLPAYARETGGTLAALAGQIVSGAGGQRGPSARRGRLSAGCAPPPFSAGHCRKETGSRAPICRNRPVALLSPARGRLWARARGADTRGYIRKLDRLDYDLSDSRAAEPLRLRGWAHRIWEGLKHGEGGAGRILADAEGRVGDGPRRRWWRREAGRLGGGARLPHREPHVEIAKAMSSPQIGTRDSETAWPDCIVEAFRRMSTATP